MRAWNFLIAASGAFTDISINKTFVVGHPNQSFLLASVGALFEIAQMPVRRKATATVAGYPYDRGSHFWMLVQTRPHDTHYLPSGRSASEVCTGKGGSARYTCGNMN